MKFRSFSRILDNDDRSDFAAGSSPEIPNFKTSSSCKRGKE